MISLRAPREIFEKRVQKFQSILRENNVDGAVIRALSTFTYFTGTRWLRPSLLIPSEGEPTVLVVEGEAEEFKRRSWIDDVVEYQDAESLMAMVVSWIKSNGYKRVGLEFSVERDAYLLFYKVFKRLNPQVEVVDILDYTFQLRMVKDEWEKENIRKAGRIANKGMKLAGEVISPGMSELEIASEVGHLLTKEGSEDPKVYVSTTPRVHAEPFRDAYVKKDSIVTVVIGADYNNYYANMARTFVVGEVNKEVRRAMQVKERAYELAIRETKPDKKFIEIEKKIAELYRHERFEEYYIKGYTHSVGLLIEEPPITTIVVAHRFWKIMRDMVLAIVHPPLMLPEGAIKHEDTFIVEDEMEKVT
ncbi:Xaa-Pro peptidase family protein [Candidatus Aciduliprofundum boonei]|uniref:Peptidase M24 n=1 Tax=Aciduliprofundum boonei (strain DSM 19572 / T469) TaxID=439481 RepID=B5IEQ1_ACIB4|nr:Xaa-Pro peptidase family protein [Candidatus Aciduliprofundum boonei]ADD07926.1 peptidase M24 [Aciduliprofundum boonei T469]EDY35248.1 peptidase, M24 family [Aciduliprofundum boonei T469]HII55578.1 aminopeptidase P family protein [Candidatus Aciduliprofundum boonei]